MPKKERPSFFTYLIDIFESSTHKELANTIGVSSATVTNWGQNNPQALQTKTRHLLEKRIKEATGKNKTLIRAEIEQALCGNSVKKAKGKEKVTQQIPMITGKTLVVTDPASNKSVQFESENDITLKEIFPFLTFAQETFGDEAKLSIK